MAISGSYEGEETFETIVVVAAGLLLLLLLLMLLLLLLLLFPRGAEDLLLGLSPENEPEPADDRMAAEEEEEDEDDRALEGDSPLSRVYTLLNASDSNARLRARFRSSSSGETNQALIISSNMPLSKSPRR